MIGIGMADDRFSYVDFTARVIAFAANNLTRV